MSYEPWFLKDLRKPLETDHKVFSCFHCGGGSTMGYKLAGYHVLGGVEIDPKMMQVYKANHHPMHSYLMGVQEFKNIPNEDLPKELFHLDILDGSPPCSSFSTAGSREKAWGEKKKFREGQAEQVLDELFFDFIDIAEKLKPKIVVAENVSGLIKGNAKYYVKRIHQAFVAAGYDVQLFLLNAAFMGVPQRRERTFFVARRKDLNLYPIKLDFKMDLIPVKEAFKDISEKGRDQSHSVNFKYWEKTKPGESFSKVHPKGSLFNCMKLNPEAPAPTIPGNAHTIYHWETMRNMSQLEFKRLQSFPDDYNFRNDREAGYMCGMSVPPKMMEKVALEIKRQWLDPMKSKIKLRKKS